MKWFDQKKRNGLKYYYNSYIMMDSHLPCIRNGLEFFTKSILYDGFSFTVYKKRSLVPYQERRINVS